MSDGSATFKGPIEAENGQTVSLQADSANGYLNSSTGIVFRTSGTANTAVIYPNGNLFIGGGSSLVANSPSGNIELNADGSGTFAGGGDFGSVVGVNRTSGSTACFAGSLNGGQTSLIQADGSADFAGTVTSADTFAIQLATDDESQYETTTETYTDIETYEVEVPVAPVLGNQVGTADLTDEPETQTITKTREVEKTREVKTYVGPVLDVKESIRSIQSALYRLKAAVLIPDSSVDELRLRILEALENISTTDIDV
jgi:hypothetical protein